jgi:glycosyltransferase involved in cell wall biosynthesis/2-polyprenyl-3-methyl-5-hydroxy-6-metoxy-1,4-benzoquinol methylase
MPVRNEAAFLPRSLDSVIAQDWPPERLEILVVDGASTDGTADVARTIAAASNAPVRVLVNPRRSAAAGMNVGVAAARGDVIVRLDGHAEAATDFVRRAVEALARTGADCVGGPIATVGDGPSGRAIAVAMSSRFGVGGAAFRTSTDAERDVDTVAFPAYRRDVFARIGTFDESFRRNQDDEFHLRLTRKGGRIVLVPEIRSTYRCRDSVAALARQYFGYGRWKPALLFKHGRLPSARGLAPPALLLALVAGVVVSVATRDPRWTIAVAAPYAFAVVVASIVGAAHGGWALLPRLPAAFATMHLCYGAGFWTGLAAGRPVDERERIRRTFARRDAAPVRDDAALVAARRRDVAELLTAEGVSLAPAARVLDVGCGRGDSLADVAADAFGVDLVEARVALARKRSPGARVAVADAAELPFRDESFDLCILSTVFSSIRDDDLRGRVADDALRVLRPGGAVVVYDFALNPLNRDVRGVPVRALRRLFPGCRVASRRTRGPVSWLPTHSVAVVRREATR